MSRALVWLRAHKLGATLALCLAGQCAPLLVTRVLPFHDAPGLIGLAGVLAHLDDPRTRDFFDVDFGAYPSIGYFGWAYLAALLHVPMDLAFHAFIAIFCLAGPPLALLLLLRAFGRPPALALLALPLGYHHQIWFGFLGSAAALTGLLAALAFARRLVDRPTVAHHLGLAGAVLFVALCHPFTLALTLLLVAPVLLWPASGVTWPARLRERGLRLACLLPTLIFLSAWARGVVARGTGEAGPGALARLAHELRITRPPLGEDLRMFVEWLGGGFRGSVDEVVVAVALVSLGAFLAAGVRCRDETSGSRAQSLWLGWAVLVLALGYLLLPNKIYWPTYWWGLRVRCAVPLFLVAVVAVRRSSRGLPPAVAGVAAAAGLFFALYVARDFQTHWKGRVLPGFDEALAAIPADQSVLAMPVIPDPHYTEPHPYLVQYYVARTGGRATPYLGGHPGSYWVTMKRPPITPTWGDRTQFDWREHGLGFDYFLLEKPLSGPDLDPFPALPEGAVTLISDRGQWRLYRRDRPPYPTDLPPR